MIVLGMKETLQIRFISPLFTVLLKNTKVISCPLQSCLSYFPNKFCFEILNEGNIYNIRPEFSHFRPSRLKLGPEMTILGTVVSSTGTSDDRFEQEMFDLSPNFWLNGMNLAYYRRYCLHLAFRNETCWINMNEKTVEVRNELLLFSCVPWKGVKWNMGLKWNRISLTTEQVNQYRNRMLLLAKIHSPILIGVKGVTLNRVWNFGRFWWLSI